MMTRHSTAERNVMLQSHLYTLERQFGNDQQLLELVGDLLPGVVLVNDMRTMQNVYMNRTGRDYLKKTSEELRLLGSEYFSNEVFCSDEMAWVARHFGALVGRNDTDEVTGFYQKVRPSTGADWSHHYLSGKLLGENTGLCIYMGMATTQSNYELHKIGLKLETESATPVAFRQFSSLTKREKQVLGLIARGLTNHQISEQLFVALYTVETHRKAINRKLGTKSLRDLILVASRFGI